MGRDFKVFPVFSHIQFIWAKHGFRFIHRLQTQYRSHLWLFYADNPDLGGVLFLIYHNALHFVFVGVNLRLAYCIPKIHKGFESQIFDGRNRTKMGKIRCLWYGDDDIPLASALKIGIINTDACSGLINNISGSLLEALS